MVLKTYSLNQGIATDSTVSPSLGVKVSALGAPIVHLVREEVGKERADDKNPSEHGYRQQSVAEILH